MHAVCGLSAQGTGGVDTAVRSNGWVYIRDLIFYKLQLSAVSAPCRKKLPALVVSIKIITVDDVHWYHSGMFQYRYIEPRLSNVAEGGDN